MTDLGVNFHSQTFSIGIVNVDKGRNLAIGSSHSENRTNVTLSNFRSSWSIIKAGNDTYRIRYANGGCYDLYAASDGFKYDSDRRRVFCWGENCNVSQGYWRFERVDNGEFLIKNTEHNEYLYAADYPDVCSVFTWDGGHLDYANNPKFRWRLTNRPPNWP